MNRGTIEGGADITCTIMAMPRFPIILRLWLPDDEMKGSANILFDSTANHYQHTEDVAVMGELAARLLVRHYEHLCAGQKELT
ncbi:MAG: DUF3786 domain-containing protein [Desulfocucumaceae bacterium]